MITVEDTTKWVDTLEDEELVQYMAIPVKQWIEFYHLQDNRSVIKWDNLQYYSSVLYAVFSPSEGRYLLRSTRDRFDHESASKRLKRYYNDGNLYLMLDEDQVDNLKQAMRRTYKHYVKEDGTFKYRAYYLLIRLIVERDRFYISNNGFDGYRTRMKQYDDKINDLITKNK